MSVIDNRPSFERKNQIRFRLVVNRSNSYFGLKLFLSVFRLKRKLITQFREFDIEGKRIKWIENKNRLFRFKLAVRNSLNAGTRAIAVQKLSQN